MSYRANRVKNSDENNTVRRYRANSNKRVSTNKIFHHRQSPTFSQIVKSPTTVSKFPGISRVFPTNGQPVCCSSSMVMWTESNKRVSTNNIFHRRQFPDFWSNSPGFSHACSARLSTVTWTDTQIRSIFKIYHHQQLPNFWSNPQQLSNSPASPSPRFPSTPLFSPPLPLMAFRTKVHAVCWS